MRRDVATLLRIADLVVGEIGDEGRGLDQWEGIPDVGRLIHPRDRHRCRRAHRMPQHPTVCSDEVLILAPVREDLARHLSRVLERSPVGFLPCDVDIPFRIGREIYQTMTGTGGRAKRSNFDITTLGGLFDAGLITLPYGGTFDEIAKVDAYIDQLCAWRTDDLGHSIRYLTRDMVMATLFAESEAFVLANRPTERKPRKPPDIPRWASNGVGG